MISLFVGQVALSKKKWSQRVSVQFDGQTVVDKRYAPSPPDDCIASWASDGVNFGMHYNEVRERCLGRHFDENIRSCAPHSYRTTVVFARFIEL